MFDESESKSSVKATLYNSLSGLLFGIAWWIIIDAAVSASRSNDPNTIPFKFCLPGIFCSFGLLMVNSVDWSVVNGFSVNERTSMYAKLWLLLAFVDQLISVFFAIFILIRDFAEKPEGSIYGGVAIAMNSFLIIISTVLLRIGRNQEEPSL